MKYDYETKLKAVLSKKAGNLIPEPFGIMKREMFYGYEKTFNSLDSLKHAMEEYLLYYNKYRINKKRKGLSLLAYRQQYFSLINN